MTHVLASILFISSVVFGNLGNHLLTATDWKTLDHEDYTIQYPSNWELSEQGQMGTSFMLLSPLKENDLFRENVNLLIQDLSGMNISLDKYVEISEGQVKSMMQNSSLAESKRIKNANGEYHKMLYTGDSGNFRLKFMQYYRIIDNKAYILTFTCEESKFKSYEKDGEKILNSFVIKK